MNHSGVYQRLYQIQNHQFQSGKQILHEELCRTRLVPPVFTRCSANVPRRIQLILSVVFQIGAIEK